MGSPWEAVLGENALSLHPRLRPYFSVIPAGSVGRGTGVFDSVGTPRRWLWPFLWLLSGDGVVFPVWEKAVPFTVTNRSSGDSVASSRVFHLAGGEREMVDAMSAVDGRIVDRLGRRGSVSATLSATVDHGMLRLDSTAVRVFGVPIPGFLAPRVLLIERVDTERQHVSLTITAPLVGRIYEYSGSFTYTIEKDTA